MVTSETLIFLGTTLMIATINTTAFILAWHGRGSDVWHRRQPGWLPLAFLSGALAGTSLVMFTTIAAIQEYFDIAIFQLFPMGFTMAYVLVFFVVVPSVPILGFRRERMKFLRPKWINVARFQNDLELARKTIWT